jgi:hypothetical protein
MPLGRGFSTGVTVALILAIAFVRQIALAMTAAASRPPGRSKKLRHASLCGTTMVRHWRSSIARMSRAGETPPNCSPAMKRGALLQTSRSCWNCSAPNQSRTRTRLFTGDSETGQRTLMLPKVPDRSPL